MKKIILLITALLLIPSLCFGAIGAGTVWEFQQNATASNANGCGFNPLNATPGTDYSQQTAAQDGGTDLACADGDAAAPVVTSASHNFVDADEGNLIHITAGTGWTAGWYEIVSTSGNAATLDRAVGTDGAKTDGTWAYGGACSSFNDAIVEAWTPGNSVYVKYNASAFTTSDAPANGEAGTAALPFKVIGYDTTRTVANTDANRPTIALSTYAYSSSAYNTHRNIIFTGTQATSTMVAIGAQNYVENCKFVNDSTNTSSSQAAVSIGTAAMMKGSEAQSAGANARGVYITTTGSMIGCYVHDATTAVGVNGSGGAALLLSNLIKVKSSGTGIKVASANNGDFIVNNTIIGSTATPSGTGIDLATGTNGFYIYNNIIAGLTMGLTASNAVQYVSDYNNYFGNTDDVNATYIAKGTNDFDTDPGFTNEAGGVYTIGAATKGLGFPGSLVTSGAAAGNVGYMDTGALQRQEPSGVSAWAQ